jgi:hypothetical protein
VRFERRSPGQYGKTVTRTHALARTTPLSQHITLPILARTALVSSHPSVAMHLASLYVGAHAQRHARNKAFLSFKTLRFSKPKRRPQHNLRAGCMVEWMVVMLPCFDVPTVQLFEHCLPHLARGRARTHLHSVVYPCHHQTYNWSVHIMQHTHSRKRPPPSPPPTNARAQHNLWSKGMLVGPLKS